MNNTKTLQKNSSHLRTLFGVTVMATLAIALLGIQNTHAAVMSQLDFGDRGPEVIKLQTYLSTDANIYPSKLVTGYFGPLTQSAVERFQNAHGIVSSGTPVTTGYGRVGPRTRAAINAELAGGDTTAPFIRSVNVNTDTNGATVSWTASESSMGKVYYSTSPIQISNMFDATGVFSGLPAVSGTLAQHDNVSRVSHTVDINNLSRNTRYFYLIVVFDEHENISITTPNSFITD